ncbi:MAG: hypothetical protein Q8O67_09515 [Deltaproteobacteria bacterium]|nr:hypothetical protein [Deltaproteobacteria bacterium]
MQTWGFVLCLTLLGLFASPATAQGGACAAAHEGRNNVGAIGRDQLVSPSILCNEFSSANSTGAMATPTNCNSINSNDGLVFMQPYHGHFMYICVGTTQKALADAFIVQTCRECSTGNPAPIINGGAGCSMPVPFGNIDPPEALGPGESCSSAQPHVVGDEDVERCGNFIDDDRDGLIDETDGPSAVEICGNGIDDDCGGEANDCDDEDCAGSGNFEICFDDLNNDCDELTPDDGDDCIDVGFMPFDDPANGEDDDGDGIPDDETPTPEECETCGGCDGEPVNLMNRQAFIGPHEDARISSPQGGAFDLVFARTWDSKRAQQDDNDDKRVAVDYQRPWQRVLGPGWRHSYEIRLLLENVDGFDRPSSVTLDRPERRTRMHAIDIAAGYYGRVPGRALSAQRSGSVWTVLDDDGTLYEFEEGTNAGTELHPWGVNNPNETDSLLDTVYAARLRTIIPGGQTGFRIRLYHEEDTSGLPTWVCSSVVGPSTVCSSSRGLLTLVAQEWLDGATWRRGSSWVLRYSQMLAGSPSIKRQLILSKIEEGADLDDNGSADATDFATYQYQTDLGWRLLASAVYSCADRTSGSSDASQGPCNEGASQRFLYETETGISGVESQHLIARVQTIMPTTANVFDTQPSEEHDWEFVDGVFRVGAHRSGQLVLSQSSQSPSPDGIKDWTRNGILRRVTFAAGRPTQTQRCDSSGANCVELVKRDFARSSENHRYTTGSRLSQDSDGVTTVSELDEDGNRTIEAEVIPVSGGAPAVHLNGTAVTFSDVSSVRRVTRHYFSADGTKRLASATVSITHQPNVADPTSTTTRQFPATLGATNWSPTIAVGSRKVPNNEIKVGNDDWFYDVDVTDYDGAGTLGTVNELGDRTPVWTHTTQTGLNGVTLYRSSRKTVDAAGRTIAQEDFAAPRAGGTNITPTRISRTDIAYEPVTLTQAARNRGRKKQVTAYATVTNTTLSDSRITWVTCTPTSTFSPYSESGEIECSDAPQSPTNFRTQITVASRNNVETEPRRRRVTRTGLPTSFEDVTSSGTVIASGLIGGNSKNFFYFSTDAVSSRVLEKIEEKDSGNTIYATRTSGHDTHGFISFQESRNAANQVRRKSEMTHDDLGRSLTQKRFTVGSTGLTTTSVVDPASGRTTSTTEPDDNVELSVYEPTGIDAGRLRRIERKVDLDPSSVPLIVREHAYDAWGRLTNVWNGSAATGELAASYVPEGGGVFREILAGVNTSTAGLVREHTASISGNVVIEDDVTKPSVGGSVVRATRLHRDALGRPKLLCQLTGTTCTDNIVQWFYDSKPAAIANTYNVEPTTLTRQVTLTSNTNQTGRLSYIVHKAGVTFFEYDTAGRIKTFIQHEGQLDLVSGSPSAAAMRVWEVSYTATGEVASVRYPSGRRMQNGYGPDKRAPIAMYIKVNVDGINGINWLVNDVVLDVDGSPIGWEWGNGVVPMIYHSIDRDLSGRITRIVDENTGDTTKKAEFKYNYNSTDEEPASFEDEGPFAPIITTASSVPPGGLLKALTHDPLRDMLTGWTDPDGLAMDLAIEPTSPATAVHRFVLNTTKPYGRTREQLTSVSSTTVGYDANDGRVLSITTPATVISGTTVGSRGDLTGYTNSAGSWTITTDEARNRWRLSQGSLIDARFRYGPSGLLTDYFRSQPTEQWSRDEYSYLLGMPIGVTHEDNQFGVTTYWLSPDAMGTPRRAFIRNATMQQIRRVVMNPWGKAVVTDDRVPATTGLPKMPFRLPGQLQDEAPVVTAGSAAPLEPIIENKYRAYFPDFGIYLQSDPAHATSVMSGMGPQVYAYANGSPLRFVDRTGSVPGAAYRTIVDAAVAAAVDVVEAHKTAIFEPDWERGCSIRQISIGHSCSEAFRRYTYTSVSLGGYLEHNPEDGPDVIGDIHSHPIGTQAPSMIDMTEWAADGRHGFMINTHGDLYYYNPKVGLPESLSIPIARRGVVAPW